MGLTASCLTAIDGVILNQDFKRRRALSDYCHELADVFPRTKLSVFSFSPLIVDSLPSLTFIPPGLCASGLIPGIPSIRIRVRLWAGRERCGFSEVSGAVEDGADGKIPYHNFERLT